MRLEWPEATQMPGTVLVCTRDPGELRQADLLWFAHGGPRVCLL
jgi:hypothetical protein